MSKPLLLSGLDGSNPLAFLTVLGVGLTSQRFCPTLSMSWQIAEGAWRPLLHGFDGRQDDFLDALYTSLADTPDEPFLVEKRLPFQVQTFHALLTKAHLTAAPAQRRTVDLLAGFGSDAHADEKAVFADTAFRMVRSGDSAGQGLLAYAIAIRRSTTRENLREALFAIWQYKDDGFSLRWDPVEDQRYALRWYDPSPQSNKKYALRTMRGTNALALEALSLLPVQPQSNGVATTGFSRQERRRDFFTWPIWETPVSTEVIRSLLAMPELALQTPPRDDLRARGIVEVYRCERIAPNQYYKNFTLAQPA